MATPEPPARKPKRRGPRRATVAGTGLASADGPEPRLDDLKPEPKSSKKPKNLSERDRWMFEQKPPHY